MYIFKIFIGAFAFLLWISPMQSQVFPSPNDDPRWSFSLINWSIDINKEEIFTSTETFTFDGILWNPVFRIDHWGEITPYPSDTTLVGYYRINEDQVFFRTPSEFLTRTGLLYDFSLSIDDEIYVLTPNDLPVDSILYKVEAVDSILCEGSYRKRLTVSYEYDDVPNWVYSFYRTYWISGIGDTYHPFLPSTCIGPPCEVAYYNQILHIAGDSIIVNDPDPCAILTTVGALAPKSVSIDILLFPNPIKKGNNVQFSLWDKGIGSRFRIDLFDVKGQLVSQIIQNGVFEVAFPTAHLAAGTYRMIVADKNGERLINQGIVIID